MGYRFSIEEIDRLTGERVRSVNAYKSEKRAQNVADTLNTENRRYFYEVWRLY